MEITAQEYFNTGDLGGTYFNFDIQNSGTSDKIKLLTFYKDNQEERLKRNLVGILRKDAFYKLFLENTDLLPLVSDNPLLLMRSRKDMKITDDILADNEAVYASEISYLKEKFRAIIEDKVKNIRRVYASAQAQLEQTKFLNWYNPMNLIKNKNKRVNYEAILVGVDKKTVEDSGIKMLYGGILAEAGLALYFANMSSNIMTTKYFIGGTLILISGGLVCIGLESSSRIRKDVMESAMRFIERLKPIVEDEKLEKFQKEVFDINEKKVPEMERAIKDASLEIIVMEEGKKIVMPVLELTAKNQFVRPDKEGLNLFLRSIYNYKE